MPEESDFCIFQLPRPCGHSLLSKSESYLSSTPPLSLEDVAFMPEESDLLCIRTPSPLRALPLIQEGELFVFNSSSEFRGGGIYAGGV